MLSIDQILTVSFTLFAVIDMPGAIPVLVSLKEKLGTAGNTSTCIEATVFPKEGSDFIVPHGE